MCVRIAFNLCVVLVLAYPARAQEPKEAALKPTLVLCGTHSAILKEQAAVVTNAAAWKELWKQHRGPTQDPPFTEQCQELDVNFESHFVVAIFAGSCDECEVTPRNRGADVVIGYRARLYSVELRARIPPIDDTRNEREKAADEAKEVREVAKEAAKAPYAFVVLPKPVKTVVIERDVRRSKFDPALWKEVFRFPAPKDEK
ncbi:hypothetical protein [Gemmata sp.]|uniref:hypothetical protein n=1 Tax=Gemmata sp. TaxID=1914242 RepID=UPI003F71063F